MSMEEAGADGLMAPAAGADPNGAECELGSVVQRADDHAAVLVPALQRQQQHQHQQGIGTALDSLAAVAAAAGHHILDNPQQQQQHSEQHSFEYGDQPGRKQKRGRNLNDMVGPGQTAGSIAAEDEIAAAARRGGTNRQHSSSASERAAVPSQQKRARYHTADDPQARHFQQAQQFQLQRQQQFLQASQFASTQANDGINDADMPEMEQQTAEPSAAAAAAAPAVPDSSSLQQSLHHRLQQLLLPELGRQAILQSLDPATQCMVECGTATGIFSVDSERILCLCSSCSAGKGPPGPEFMPSEFERHGGMAACKKWRFSIKVADGGPGMTLGRWLDMRGIQISSYPTKSRNPTSRQKRPLDASKLPVAAASAPNIQLNVSQLLSGLVSGNTQLAGSLKGAVAGAAASTPAATSSSAPSSAVPGTVTSAVPSAVPRTPPGTLAGSASAGASGSVGPGDLAALFSSSAGPNSSARLTELAAAVAEMLMKEIPAAAAVAAAVPGLAATSADMSTAAGTSADEPTSTGLPLLHTSTAVLALPDTAVTTAPNTDDVPLGYAIAAQVATDEGVREDPHYWQQPALLQSRATLPSGMGSVPPALLQMPSNQSATNSVKLASPALAAQASLVASALGPQQLEQLGLSGDASSKTAIMHMLQRFHEQHPASPVRLHAGLGQPGDLQPQQQRLQQMSSMPPPARVSRDHGVIASNMEAARRIQRSTSAAAGADVDAAQREAAAAAAAAGMAHPGHSNTLQEQQRLEQHQQHQPVSPFGAAAAADGSVMHDLVVGYHSGPAGFSSDGVFSGRAPHAAFKEDTACTRSAAPDAAFMLSSKSAAGGPLYSGLERLGSFQQQHQQQQQSHADALHADAAAALADSDLAAPAAAPSVPERPSTEWRKLVGSVESRLDGLLEDRKRKQQLEEQVAELQARLAHVEAQLAVEQTRRREAEQKFAALSSMLLDKLEANGSDSVKLANGVAAASNSTAIAGVQAPAPAAGCDGVVTEPVAAVFGGLVPSRSAAASVAASQLRTAPAAGAHQPLGSPVRHGPSMVPAYGTAAQALEGVVQTVTNHAALPMPDSTEPGMAAVPHVDGAAPRAVKVEQDQGAVKEAEAASGSMEAAGSR